MHYIISLAALSYAACLQIRQRHACFQVNLLGWVWQVDGLERSPSLLFHCNPGGNVTMEQLKPNDFSLQLNRGLHFLNPRDSRLTFNDFDCEDYFYFRSSALAKLKKA